ncbi:hypothetical protein DUNSADRAFT_4890 [Dunaliella salina]|uniref:Amine oxidase domain-containing protein n=1 Tax=Dunaliella salina TaxID=3046 RepID=A0ABQ7GR24_DUNSA|nr:hypothetical protein DUNSADRAFT_4890 [Dunaliella salina]|eukprot:KAF5837057.1 hypothetical protein DUNSADRAFT_4890 [Dunaliella salina]
MRTFLRSPPLLKRVSFDLLPSGIGGLCCAALLARYGYKVTVLESHYLPGGAAHSFKIGGYSFDAGPSFFVGLSNEKGTSSNPLKQVLDAIDEPVPAKQYDRWIVYTQNGQGEFGAFPCVAGREAYLENVERQGGQRALEQFLALEKEMAPLQQGAASFPAAAIRSDPGVLLTFARFLSPELAATGLVANQLTGPFSAVVDRVVSNRWLRAFLDLECFVLSGMTAKDTLCAEMAFMFLERNAGKSAIDYPMGGSKGVVDALVRGIKKYGGQIKLMSHVEEIIMENGKAAGVRVRNKRLKKEDTPGLEDADAVASTNGSSTSGAQAGSTGQVLRAKAGVISNASVWDMLKLLPPQDVPQDWRQERAATPALDSFMHLHLGIDATGLPSDLECHHLIINDLFGDLAAPHNVCIVSIPTVFDPKLAPPGKAVVHAYYAANEPYDLWKGMDTKSPEYKALKEERAEGLWQALEKVIPDIRKRAELTLIGTPLTHERFLNTHRGTYGPGISASESPGGWPGPKTPVPGLYVCGASTMPGIGVPAAAASGMMCANTLASPWQHLQLMDELVPKK